MKLFDKAEIRKRVKEERETPRVFLPVIPNRLIGAEIAGNSPQITANNPHVAASSQIVCHNYSSLSLESPHVFPLHTFIHLPYIARPLTFMNEELFLELHEEETTIIQVGLNKFSYYIASYIIYRYLRL